MIETIARAGDVYNPYVAREVNLVHKPMNERKWLVSVSHGDIKRSHCDCCGDYVVLDEYDAMSTNDRQLAIAVFMAIANHYELDIEISEGLNS